MDEKKNTIFSWNAGTGMAVGVFIAALIALLVSIITDDQSIWAWAIPVGLAIGVAVGTSRQKKEHKS